MSLPPWSNPKSTADTAWIDAALSEVAAKARMQDLLPKAMKLLVEVGKEAQENNDGRIRVELYEEIHEFVTEGARTFTAAPNAL
jgi:hypothetical protein